MLDLVLTNLSCIYAAYLFIDDICKKNGIDPVVTFDQPLLLNARLIVNQEEQLKDCLKPWWCSYHHEFSWNSW